LTDNKVKKINPFKKRLSVATVYHISDVRWVTSVNRKAQYALVLLAHETVAVLRSGLGSASEMTYIVSSGALNSTHSLTHAVAWEHSPQFWPRPPISPQFVTPYELRNSKRPRSTLKCVR